MTQMSMRMNNSIPIAPPNAPAPGTVLPEFEVWRRVDRTLQLRVGGYVGNNIDGNANAVEIKADVAREKARSRAEVMEHRQQKARRRTLEQDLNRLLSRIFPDFGVRFSRHESGIIMTRIIDNATEEIVREFPAENILDIIHSMMQRIQNTSPSANSQRSYSGIPPRMSGNVASIYEAAAAYQPRPRGPIGFSAEYADAQLWHALELDFDRLLMQIFPEDSYEIYDSGVIMSKADEVVREFLKPENLDVIYSILNGIGAVTNRKM